MQDLTEHMDRRAGQVLLSSIHQPRLSHRPIWTKATLLESWVYGNAAMPVLGVSGAFLILWLAYLLLVREGGPPFRFFSIQESARLDCTTPIPQRRGTGLAFAGAAPFVIVKGWGFRFQYDRECESGGSENPHPCPPRRTRVGHPHPEIQNPFIKMGAPPKPGPPAPIHSREMNKSFQNWPCSMRSVRLAVRIRNRHSSHRLQAQFHTSEARSSCLQIQLRLDLLPQTHE